MIPTVGKQREINTVSKGLSVHSLFSSACVHMGLSSSNSTGTITGKADQNISCEKFPRETGSFGKIYINFVTNRSARTSSLAFHSNSVTWELVIQGSQQV